MKRFASLLTALSLAAFMAGCAGEESKPAGDDGGEVNVTAPEGDGHGEGDHTHAEGEEHKEGEGEGAAPAEGEGAAPAEGEGAAPAEGEGAAPAEGEGGGEVGEAEAPGPKLPAADPNTIRGRTGPPRGNGGASLETATPLRLA